MLGPLSLSLLLITEPAADAPSEYLAELQREADRLDLASDPYWGKLLHYHDRNLGPRYSTAVSPGFFLAPGGRRDGAAELHATIDAFFEPVVEGVEHPQCRFVARYRWLDERLALDESRLPRHACPELDEWYRGIGSDRLTLVFASAYLNNPASMYGHTLLRLDRAAGGETPDPLVAYAINHAAQTEETNGIVFAIRGIFGGYLGRYSILPYYQKVEAYNDLESRDLWEYELALTPEETDRVLWHTWELRETGFRYYFFLQNCSYRLLELLELARPGLELTDDFRLWAMPVDTVREVLEVEGMLRRVELRPGAANVLGHHLRLLSREERSLAHDLALGRAAIDDARLVALGPERQAPVLRVAYEYLHYLLRRGKAPGPDTPSRLRALLAARSQVPTSGSLEPPPVPEVRPDLGHATARLALGWGRSDGRSFQALRVRPSYHDLLDPQGGFQENAEIRFLDIEARHYPEGPDLQLERLDVVKIQSIAPRDRFFTPASWNVGVGLVRQPIEGGARPLVAELEGGSAWAHRFPQASGLVAYGGWQSDLQVDHALPRSWRVGVGPRVGALADLGRIGRLQLDARSLWHLEESDPSWAVRVEQRVPLNQALAIGAYAGRSAALDHSTKEFAAALYWYF